MLREVQKQDTKQLIFTKAIKLFKEKGYDHVTVQEIASTCGIAKGTFFNYFSKKEDVLLYFGESQLQLLEQNLKTYQSVSDPKQKIVTLLGELLKRYSAEGELMKLVISEIVRSAFVSAMESNSIKRLESVLADIINGAKQQGTLHSVHDTELISSVVIGAYFHTMMTWSLLHTSGEPIDYHFERHLSAVWHGVCFVKEEHLS